ncbi:myo-inositol transport ITR1 [Fusarium beomiforme]|uniref:Myo-inositol transport ITR1 n=1 Tax=Fusarium beomiforme TaxID=44412 RepID=A0A9P5AI62_9HYPO|nr:myo-inositol transport ITR1 [Fusarium beomiforme]
METNKESPSHLRSESTPQDAGVPQAKNGPSTAVLQNPLTNMTREEILADVARFVQDKGLTIDRPCFSKGALLAKVINTPRGYETIEMLNEDDKETLRNEDDHRWTSHPKMLYFLCALCAGCAIVQGMDQTVINGAQHFYFEEYGIKKRALQGLTNGAPYASAALIGCWLNAPLNRYFGRRGTIAFSCLFAFITGIWQAAADSWLCLLIARFTLGLAVGAKSSTTPIYAAECAPKAIRGALTMMWQMWTAFGIMLGFASSLAFQNLKWPNEYSPWRWMIGSTSLPPLIVGILVFFLPESPRWYMDKGDFQSAYLSLRKLRQDDIQASRDLYLAWKFLEVERNSKEGRNVLKEFFTVRRNWRAAQSSWFCMLMQQFCGVNVIAYYSTKIFTDAGYTRSQALLASFGGGAINWIFALPAIWTIDTFGRRNLLLVTFPLMSACLYWTGSSFSIEDNSIRLPLIATSIYIFMAVYSPGLGPVPFTYSAEAFPLHIRALGMASATSITWSFNFLLSFTWPMMERSFRPSGAFYWYATWNMVGLIFAYFLLPETKALSLEELDLVFSIRNRDHVRYYLKQMGWYAQRIMGRNPDLMPPLYQLENPTAGSIFEMASKQTNSSST